MFQGFSDAAFDFMWGIRFNNERPWFEAHKSEYLDAFYRPMKELAQEVYDAFQARHAVPGLCCKVSRIYRDARRLHGRGPYKDHLWWSMERPSDDPFSTRPVFLVRADPRELVLRPGLLLRHTPHHGQVPCPAGPGPPDL